MRISWKSVKRLILFYISVIGGISLLYLFYWWWMWKPNVVLITIDALYANHLGCYGYKRDTSPTIDEIASRGIIFSHTIAQAPWTSASIASLLSSSYTRVHGITGDTSKLASQLPILAEILKKDGYYTVAFINQPLLNKTNGHGFDRGFILYHSPYANDYPVEEQYRGDQKLTEDVVQWLKKNRWERFFLWIHYMNPHGPYTPPHQYNNLFKNDGLYATGKKMPLHDENLHFNHIDKKQAKYLGYSTDVDTYISQYDGEIRFIDDQIGRLVRDMKELGLFRNSAIIITSDHGESMGENDWYFEHGMPFETIVKVPLIIKPPGMITRRRVDSLVGLIDVAPTILDIVGVQPPTSFQGQSMAPLIRGEEIDVRKYAFGDTGYMDHHYIRTSKYKLIVKKPWSAWPKKDFYKDYFGGREEITELYDIQADPHETINLAEDKPEVVATLRSQLDLWKKEQDARAEQFKTGRMEKAVFDDKTREQLKALGYIH